VPDEPIVLVDARNVLRSEWPNIPEQELVEATRAWAAAGGFRPLIVFDGRAPEDAPDVVGTSAETADDWISRKAAELAAERRRYVLVTSDRELRRRAGAAAQRTIGGGSFARELRTGRS
jgi:predicted RNA-binding protein with PIN domain